MANGKLIADRLTAVQAHILTGDIFERFVALGKPPPNQIALIGSTDPH